MFIKQLYRGVTAALALSLLAGLASAQTYKPEYKLGTAGIPGTHFGAIPEEWARFVKERTNGRINIKIFYGNALVGGDQAKVFPSIRQGLYDMSVDGAITLSSQVKELNLLALPFIFPDQRAVDAVLQGAPGKELFTAMERSGITPLAWGVHGFRELSNSSREVRKPSDLSGMKIRVTSPLMLETFAALGANPTQMGFADLQSALATGAVDGQELPLVTFNDVKMHTLRQKYITLTGYSFDTLVLSVNNSAWQTWTAADREIVRVAAVEAGKNSAARANAPYGESGLKDLAAKGVTVTTLTAGEKTAFRDAVKGVYAKWALAIGPDLVKKAEAIVGQKPL